MKKPPLKSKKKPRPYEGFIYQVHAVMKTYGLSYQDIMEMPIPMFWALLDCIQYEQEEHERLING